MNTPEGCILIKNDTLGPCPVQGCGTKTVQVGESGDFKIAKAEVRPNRIMCTYSQVIMDSIKVHTRRLN